MTQHWTNRPVVDEHLTRVGKVTDVIFGAVGDDPEWATVKTGLLTERLTPLDGAYISDEGMVVLPFDHKVVKAAPKPPRDHVLSPSLAAEAIQHYDMN
jgi:hypothetical protein